MIALVLGALVVLAATGVVVASRGTYRTQDEATRLAESARFATELISRQIRQAGYTEFGDSMTPPASFVQPAFSGHVLEDYAQVGGNDNASTDFAAPINGSDILLLRSGFGAQPDTTAQTYYLFGPSYPTRGDVGTQFSTLSLSVPERTRLRRVVQTTVFTRNRQGMWPSVQQ